MPHLRWRAIASRTTGFTLSPRTRADLDVQICHTRNVVAHDEGELVVNLRLSSEFQAQKSLFLSLGLLIVSTDQLLYFGESLLTPIQQSAAIQVQHGYGYIANIGRRNQRWSIRRKVLTRILEIRIDQTERGLPVGTFARIADRAAETHILVRKREILTIHLRSDVLDSALIDVRNCGLAIHAFPARSTGERSFYRFCGAVVVCQRLWNRQTLLQYCLQFCITLQEALLGRGVEQRPVQPEHLVGRVGELCYRRRRIIVEPKLGEIAAKVF